LYKRISLEMAYPSQSILKNPDVLIKYETEG